MKPLFAVVAFACLMVSCGVVRPVQSPSGSGYSDTDQQITQSLFNDKASTISEEGIQKVLNGNFKMPGQMRVAIVRLENIRPEHHWYYRSDEEYIKTQQAYLDVFSEKLALSPRVTKISVVPDLLISRTPTFTGIREAAVRMQADMVLIYSITSDIYSKYRVFSKTDIKAYATTQVIMLDVKTGLVPFSAVVTKDFLTKRKKEELEDAEARGRARHEAVLLTIFEIGQRLAEFLKTK